MTLSIILTILFSAAMSNEFNASLILPTISIEQFVNANFSVKRSIATTFDECMQNHGFFYLDLNGISSEIDHKLYLLSEVYQASSLFFHNKLEYKRQFSGVLRGSSGYQSPNNERAAFKELDDNTNPEQCKCPDLNENFRWRPADDDPNSDFILPPQFKTSDEQNILSLYSQFLSNEILPTLHQIASLALNISDIDYFANKIYDLKPWSIAIRINHYYELSNDGVNSKCGMRLGAHCDYVGFTLLLTDQISGLQGMNKNGEWYNIPSPTKKNVLIVNAGEMIERGTNKVWLAAKHRVSQDINEERISIALFTGPNRKTLIKPFIDCAICNKDPYKFGEIVSVEQHVLNRLNDLEMQNHQ